MLFRHCAGFLLPSLDYSTQCIPQAQSQGRHKYSKCATWGCTFCKGLFNMTRMAVSHKGTFQALIMHLMQLDTPFYICAVQNLHTTLRSVSRNQSDHSALLVQNCMPEKKSVWPSVGFCMKTCTICCVSTCKVHISRKMHWEWITSV